MASEILEVSELERYLEVLAECKQLREEDVKILCDKVFYSQFLCITVNVGKRGVNERIKCTTSTISSYCLW